MSSKPYVSITKHVKCQDRELNNTSTNVYEKIENKYQLLEDKYKKLEDKYETLVQAFLKHGNDIEYIKNKYNQTIFAVKENENDNFGFWYYKDVRENILEPIKLTITRDIGLEHIKRKIVEKIYQDYCGIVIEYNKKIKKSISYPMPKNNYLYTSDLSASTSSEENESECNNEEYDNEEGHDDDDGSENEREVEDDNEDECDDEGENENKKSENLENKDKYYFDYGESY